MRLTPGYTGRLQGQPNESHILQPAPLRVPMGDGADASLVSSRFHDSFDSTANCNFRKNRKRRNKAKEKEKREAKE